jgi:hypothetical protein
MGVGLLVRENIRDDPGGGDCGAKMQGASAALAKPNGPVRAYRIIRAVRAVPLVGVFHRTLGEVALVLH